MSGIFLSHASADKETILRLAVDLSARGIPVWLDAWNLEIGDALGQRVIDGIDGSSLLVVALSPNALASEWVTKELRSALDKENGIGRKFVLPIRLAECALPLEIVDRVYADFSKSYSNGLDALEHALRKNLPELRAVPLRNRILPLRIKQGINLDRVSLNPAFEHIVPLIKTGQLLQPDQVVVVPEPDFDSMRGAMNEVADRVDTGVYAPDLETFFRETIETVRRLEKRIPYGVAAIANGLIENNDWAFFSMAVAWYVRLARTELLTHLSRIWPFARETLPPPLAPKTEHGGLMSRPESAAKFYGVAKVRSFDIFAPDQSTYFKVWFDEASEVAQWVRLPEPLRAYLTPDLAYKYVVPQMVWYYLANRKDLSEVPWNYPTWLVGPA